VSTVAKRKKNKQTLSFSMSGRRGARRGGHRGGSQLDLDAMASRFHRAGELVKAKNYKELNALFPDGDAMQFVVGMGSRDPELLVEAATALKPKADQLPQLARHLSLSQLEIIVAATDFRGVTPSVLNFIAKYFELAMVVARRLEAMPGGIPAEAKALRRACAAARFYTSPRLPSTE